MKKIYLISILALLCASLNSHAQLGKLKSIIPAKKETTEASIVPDSVREKKGGQNLWSKVVAKAAKAAGNLAGSMMGMVGTTADLESLVPGAYYMSNLHPTSVGVVSQSFFEGWEPGGNAVMLSFSSKNKMQFNKIEGTVNVDGKSANYVALGIYSLFFKDNSPKRVEVTTNSGQTSAFTIHPPKQSVKLRSINGQVSNISLDLTKDVVLELENLPVQDQTQIGVTIAANTLGIKTFYEVGWFAPASKITIPAAMFRNMNGVANNLNFTDSYLQVSRASTDKATNVSGVFSEMEYFNIVTDGKFITVTGKPVFNKGLVAAATEKFPKGDVSYEVKKPNAIFSPNLSRMKTLAFTSFAIQGKTSYFDSKTKYSGNDTYTTTTKTAQFPQFSDAAWDHVLDKMYTEVV
ncbi:hypothetical protein, partial [Pedobacter glucosidilyticus]|uniref:hypothetical protein n=1 Tax=Pedobacter glucosidilyticus TaxID=1122941 RepID=UPI0026EA393F